MGISSVNKVIVSGILAATQPPHTFIDDDGRRILTFWVKVEGTSAIPVEIHDADDALVAFFRIGKSGCEVDVFGSLATTRRISAQLRVVAYAVLVTDHDGVPHPFNVARKGGRAGGVLREGGVVAHEGSNIHEGIVDASEIGNLVRVSRYSSASKGDAQGVLSIVDDDGIEVCEHASYDAHADLADHGGEHRDTWIPMSDIRWVATITEARP